MITLSQSNKYNAYFSFNGEKQYVYVTDMSYSVQMKSNGSSQAKYAQTIYPYRVEKSPLSVSLVFASVEEYEAFRDFISSYHFSMAESAGATSNMLFVSTHYMDPHESSWIKKKGEERYKVETGKHFRYEVAIETLPYKRDYKTIAPEITLSLTILDDGDKYDATSSGSGASGSMDDLVIGGRVDADYVSSSVASIGSAISNAFGGRF